MEKAFFTQAWRSAEQGLFLFLGALLFVEAKAVWMNGSGSFFRFLHSIVPSQRCHPPYDQKRAVTSILPTTHRTVNKTR